MGNLASSRRSSRCTSTSAPGDPVDFSSFSILRSIGRGSYGKVRTVQFSYWCCSVWAFITQGCQLQYSESWLKNSENFKIINCEHDIRYEYPETMLFPIQSKHNFQPVSAFELIHWLFIIQNDWCIAVTTNKILIAANIFWVVKNYLAQEPRVLRAEIQYQYACRPTVYRSDFWLRGEFGDLLFSMKNFCENWNQFLLYPYFSQNHFPTHIKCAPKVTTLSKVTPVGITYLVAPMLCMFFCRYALLRRRIPSSCLPWSTWIRPSALKQELSLIYFKNWDCCGL